MLITRAAVVEETMSWMRTPWHHQASAKGVGTDCIGMVRGVMSGCGAMPANLSAWPGVERFTLDYGRQPANGALVAACDAYLQRIDVDTIDLGDVLAFRFAQEPQHLAIVVPYHAGGLGIVHALSKVGFVTEHRLSMAWRARITHAWRIPGVA